MDTLSQMDPVLFQWLQVFLGLAMGYAFVKLVDILVTVLEDHRYTFGDLSRPSAFSRRIVIEEEDEEKVDKQD